MTYSFSNPIKWLEEQDFKALSSVPLRDWRFCNSLTLTRYLTILNGGIELNKHVNVVLMETHFYVCRHEGVSHPHPQQQTQQQLQPGGMNPTEGRCGTPPATGSPDRQDKATLKVHLPNGGFNVVKFGDAIDVKVRSHRKHLAKFRFVLLGFYVELASVTWKFHHLLYKL
jgi:hypothetical protein